MSLDASTVTALVAAAAGLGILLSMFDALPYVRDILKGTTRPHRGTWLIWSVLAWLALGSNWADGASWSLLPLAAQAVLCCVILVLSLPRGEGGLGAGELLMFGIAGVGVYTAVTFTDPTLATYGVIVADVAGALMMVPKSWRDPYSETVSTFVLTSLVGCCALVSVGELDPALMAYPAYYIVVNASIAALLLLRRRSRADSTRRRRIGWGKPSRRRRVLGSMMQPSTASVSRTTEPDGGNRSGGPVDRDPVDLHVDL